MTHVHVLRTVFACSLLLACGSSGEVSSSNTGESTSTNASGGTTTGAANTASTSATLSSSVGQSSASTTAASTVAGATGTTTTGATTASGSGGATTTQSSQASSTGAGGDGTVAGADTTTTGTSTTDTTAASSTTSTSTTGGVAACESGPLDAPLPDCAPLPVPDTGDFHADCVARINQFRWECQCLPPLERWVEGEDCANQHAEYDANLDQAHAGIRAGICEPGNAGQNECLNYGPSFDILDFCLQQMWDEGPGEDFQVHGHYINMSDPDSRRVACGIYVAPNGDVTSVQNFQ